MIAYGILSVKIFQKGLVIQKIIESDDWFVQEKNKER